MYFIQIKNLLNIKIKEYDNDKIIKEWSRVRRKELVIPGKWSQR